MRRTWLLLSLFCLFVLTGFGQTKSQVAPIPSDPFELATGPAQVVDTPAERASIIALLEHARQNNNLHGGGTPYDLKVSFSAPGQSQNTGAGVLDETWAAPTSWRWTERLGAYTQDRVFYRGVAYDTGTQTYQPLRLQMIRQAIFWPINVNFTTSRIRVAPAQWNGKAVSCVLLSIGKSSSDATAGRRWEEEEFCIEPQTGLLQTYSIAPGLYNIYDYSNPIEFHGHTIARQISIVENGATIAQAQIDSLSDLGTVDSNMFAPTQEMRSNGVILREPVRFPQVVRDSKTASAGTIQPVVVVAALDTNGKVLEAEALQTSDPTLSEEALRLVKETNYGPVRSAAPLQREVFIKVLFLSGKEK